MKKPMVKQAKKHAEELGARGVILLAFSDNRVHGVSYGRTKSDCRAMKLVHDEFIDMLITGEVEVEF